MNIKGLCKWALCAALAAAFWVIPAQATELSFEPEPTEIFEFQYDPLQQARPVESDTVSLLGRETAFETDHTCYRDQLDSEEQVAYDAIHESVSAGTYTIGIRLKGGYTGENIERLFGILSAYYNDHPLETAVMTGAVGYYFQGSSYVVELKTLISDASVSDLEMAPEVMLEQLKAAVEDFYKVYTRDVAADASDLEKYQYVYEYITMQCTYNYDEGYGMGTLSPTEKTNAHNAYGALVGLGMEDGVPYGKGNVVCQGYAEAYMVLCQRIGLPCITIVGALGVPGNIPTVSNHMWNAVKLDGAWYAVDATADDYEFQMTPGMVQGFSSQLKIETTAYQYFTDNRYFHTEDGERQDHQAYTQFEYYGFDWNMGSPELSNTRYAEERIIPQDLKLVLEAAEEEEIAQFADVLLALQLDFLGQGWKSEMIPNVSIVLMTDAEISNAYWFREPLQIPDGYTYTVVRGVGASGSTITRGEGYSDSFFVVQPGGTLLLGGVTLDGASLPATAPLIDASSREDATEKCGTIYLLDSDAINNAGACGIDCDGAVIMSGSCLISGNTKVNGDPENLYLGTKGIILVNGSMANAQIGVTTEEGYPFAWAADDYVWTEVDKAVFRSDDPDLHFAYDRVRDCLYCTNLYTTDDRQPISFCWVERPTLETVGVETLYLRNHTNVDQSVQLWAAMYDVNDRLISSVYLGEMTLETGEFSVLTVPQSTPETVRYQLVAMDAVSGCPLSEALTITE